MMLRKQEKKGFIALATVILMLACLGIILAILFRSVQGQGAVKNLKQGDQAYQNVDSDAEQFLRVLRNLDKNQSESVTVWLNGKSYLAEKHKLAQTVSANSLCDDLDVVCFSEDANHNLQAITMDDRASDIVAFSLKESSDATTRAVRVPVPSHITVGGGATGTREVPILLNATMSGDNVTLQFESLRNSPLVDKIEVRRFDCNENVIADCLGGVDAENAESGNIVRGENPEPSPIAFEKHNVEWKYIGSVDKTTSGDEESRSEFIDSLTGSNEPQATTKKMFYIIKATSNKALQFDSEYSNILYVDN